MSTIEYWVLGGLAGCVVGFLAWDQRRLNGEVAREARSENQRPYPAAAYKASSGPEGSPGGDSGSCGGDGSGCGGD
jgi:hypothetical protein